MTLLSVPSAPVKFLPVRETTSTLPPFSYTPQPHPASQAPNSCCRLPPASQSSGLTPTKVSFCPQLGRAHLFPPTQAAPSDAGKAVLPQMSSGSIPPPWDSQAGLFAQLKVLEGQSFTYTEEVGGGSAEGSCGQGHYLLTE